MRTLLGSLFVLGCFTGAARAADRLNQLFASWEKAQCKTHSLVVEFTREDNDTIFNHRALAEGTFRLLRTAEGDLLASYEEWVKDPKGPKSRRGSFLFHQGAVYVLQHDEKTALKIDAESLRRIFQTTPPAVFFSTINPFVLLLDRKAAEERLTLEIVNQDEHYTYLGIKPKKEMEKEWSWIRIEEGRAVFTNKASENRPKAMPRQIWYRLPGGMEMTFDIKTWRVNAPDGPNAEDFATPETWPGWKVVAHGDQSKGLEKRSEPVRASSKNQTETEPAQRKKAP
jgi:hypothetical protein